MIFITLFTVQYCLCSVNCTRWFLTVNWVWKEPVAKFWMETMTKWDRPSSYLCYCWALSEIRGVRIHHCQLQSEIYTASMISQSVPWHYHFLCDLVLPWLQPRLISDSTFLPPLQAQFNVQSSSHIKSRCVCLSPPILPISAYTPHLQGGFSWTHYQRTLSQLLLIPLAWFIFLSALNL